MQRAIKKNEKKEEKKKKKGSSCVSLSIAVRVSHLYSALLMQCIVCIYLILFLLLFLHRACVHWLTLHLSRVNTAYYGYYDCHSLDRLLARYTSSHFHPAHHSTVFLVNSLSYSIFYSLPCRSWSASLPAVVCSFWVRRSLSSLPVSWRARDCSCE